MAPYFPLGYLSEQNTGAFVTFFAGGNFHARSPNPLVLLSLRKTRDYLSPIWGGLLDESKGPQRRRQYCLVHARLLGFFVYVEQCYKFFTIRSSRASVRADNSQVSFLYTICIYFIYTEIFASNFAV